MWSSFAFAAVVQFANCCGIYTISCFLCRVDLHDVIKVSDFGLTEDVYARNYFRQGREDGVVKLPVKWMSPESLNDGVFTEKTDVVRTELEVERCTMFVG